MIKLGDRKTIRDILFEVVFIDVDEYGALSVEWKQVK